MGFKCWSVVLRVLLFFHIATANLLYGGRTKFSLDVLQHRYGRSKPGSVYGCGTSKRRLHRQHLYVLTYLQLLKSHPNEVTAHELRSPLHGILASTEFLAETESDPFQNSLVDTITSCGRTLLDTVNHILDYSKINSYEKNWDTARKSRSQKSTMVIKSQAAVARPPDKEAPPLLNLYATVDVAAVAEEVVEGVYAGQIYQDSKCLMYAYSLTKTPLSSADTWL